MAIKKLEDYNHDIEVNKEVLSSMPINNAKNLALYQAKVKKLKDEYGSYREALFSEIKRRTSNYLNFIPSKRVDTIKKELLDYKDLSLFNPMNTPFEKMGFDTLLYSLTHYYKNDLSEVNADIKEALAKFSEAGITLTSEDFIYSNYAKRYIKELLKDDDLDRMKDVFEDLHWKCPDVISHIETSFRILFNKNIKAFDKYIQDKQNEVISGGLTYNDFVLKRDNLSKELYELNHYEPNVLVDKFMNGKLLLNDYSIVSVSKCYSHFLGDNCDVNKGKEKAQDLKNLLYNLCEFKNYLKYSFVLDDVKNKFKEAANHQGETAKINKEINAIIDSLVKLTSEINSGKTRGFLFFRKKVDIEKNYLEINEKVKELDLKYEEYDNAVVYEKMLEHLTDTSSIYDVFKFVLAFKGYLRSCIKAKEEDVDINKVKRIVKEFSEFLNDPTLNVLKNIPFNVDSDVAMIIMDHYKLLEINVKKDDMNIDDVDGLIHDLNIIINTYYLENAGLTIDLILNLFESKKLIDTYK